MKKLVVFGMLAAMAVSCNGAVFDAVSIRPSPPDARGGGFNLSPGRLNGKNVSLEDLVRFAYDLHDYQLSGGSGWMQTEHYEVLATFPADTTNAQRSRMLQAMLTERFALSVHREPKEVPGYALVVGKNGPKLHPPQAQEHGMMLGRSASGQRTLHGTSASMSGLASILADMLGRPVSDATGLTGIFDFSMEWTPDPVSEAPMRKGGPAQEPAPDGETGPSIFTALQEQLGLKLETQKASVEGVIIGHAGKPAAN